MDRERQREIARKGGRAAHQKGTAHEFTSDEARAAGRKGGERVSADRDHMSRIGRLGGKHSAGRRAAKSQGPEDTTSGEDRDMSETSEPMQESTASMGLQEPAGVPDDSASEE